MYEAAEYLPQELLLATFKHMDRRTLKSIRLVCRLFAVLSWEEILRELTWHNPDGPANAECWKADPALALRPRDLSVRFGTGPPKAYVLNRISSFTQLEELTILESVIPTQLCDVLHQLRNIQSLTLDHCSLPETLMEPSLLLSRHSSNTSAVTTLKLNIVDPRLPHPHWGQELRCGGLIALLPRMRTLHIDRCFLPVESLGSMTVELIICIPHLGDGDTIRFGRKYFCRLLREMPQLQRLTATESQCKIRINSTSLQGIPHIAPITMDELPILPRLTHFTGGTQLGHLALSARHALEEVRIEEEGEAVIKFIEFLQLQQASVRRLDIRVLKRWDAEVVRAVCYCLPSCEVLAIEHDGETASEGELLDLGSHYLSHLVNLRELSILQNPPQIEEDIKDDAEIAGDLAYAMALQLELSKMSRRQENDDKECIEDIHDELEPAGILACWTRNNHALLRARISWSGSIRWVRECHPYTKEWITYSVRMS
ncbi:hypothetical protein B0H15DRAFT_956434 [Mycena belliarum]|uniref:F-box domain-containing protein n=1 Tax=Mycena belliarum TaxID=1033014 RepID=A0AAD6TPC7_9AGAR|nr:hypothetical protein B0H15DRAFT_956434 [Mycena belliae]